MYHSKQHENISDHDGGEQFQEIFNPQMHDPKTPEVGRGEVGVRAREKADGVKRGDRKPGEKKSMPFRLTPDRIKKSENDIKKACVDLLRWRGLYPLRLQSGVFQTRDGRYVTIGELGLPDYVVPAFLMEVKKPGGHLSEAQLVKIAELEQHWQLKTAVVDSVDALIAWLNVPNVSPDTSNVSKVPSDSRAKP